MATQPIIPPKLPATPTDVEAIKILNQHYQSDTNIINIKIVQYIAVQTLLVIALQKTGWKEWFIAGLGILSSLCWFFSMNRTYSFRGHWVDEAKKLIASKNGLESFNFLGTEEFKWLGNVSSSVVQVALPAIGFLCWGYFLIPR